MVKNVNAIDTSGFVKKGDYDDKISDIEGKIPSVTGLATIATLLLLRIRYTTLVI